MTTTVTRQELYDLVWSTPLKTLAPQFNVSDVGLKKACLRGNVPVPPRGYWAKLQAGRKVVKLKLPARSPGMDDEVTIGGRQYWYRSYSNEELLGPLPPEPVFHTPIEEIRAETFGQIGRVTVPRDLSMPHLAVAALIKQDDERRAKHSQAPYMATYYPLLFDSSAERRRLRIASAILTAVSKLGYRSTSDKDGKDFYVGVGSQSVRLSLEYAQTKHKASHRRGASKKSSLVVSIGREERNWRDGEDDQIERHLRTIAAEIIVAGEEQYRSSCFSSYKWRVERKSALEEQQRKAIEEAQRREREHLEQLERERTERLLGQATALRQANEIRAYVKAVEEANAATAKQRPNLDVGIWRIWALDQADRLDPTVNGSWTVDCESVLREKMPGRQWSDEKTAL